MNIWFHWICGGLAVLFFLWEFVRQRKPYQLVFACWVASSFLIYLSGARAFRIGLGIAELLFCAAALAALWRERRREARRRRENGEAPQKAAESEE